MSGDTLICVQGVVGCTVFLLLAAAIFWAGERRIKKLEDWADQLAVGLLVVFVVACIAIPSGVFGVLFAFGLVQQVFK